MRKLDTQKANGGTAALTTAPVEPSTAVDPEFVDLPGLQARFNIKRSLAYLLIADGAIKSVSLRRRGALKGKRLIDVASVREFLRSRMG
jgi:hypothetical protein